MYFAQEVHNGLLDGLGVGQRCEVGALGAEWSIRVRSALCVFGELPDAIDAAQRGYGLTWINHKSERFVIELLLCASLSWVRGRRETPSRELRPEFQ